MSAEGPQAASGTVYAGRPASSDRMHEPASPGLHGAFLSLRQRVTVLAR